MSTIKNTQLPIYTKVRNGTRSDSKDLCRTCSRSVVVKGGAESCELVYCNIIEKEITFRVAECNSYIDRSAVSVSDLYEIAWVLRTTKSGKTIGFMTPDQFKKTKEGKEDRYGY